MQHFQRGAHFLYAIRKGTRDHATSFHAQDWTNAFAAARLDVLADLGDQIDLRFNLTAEFAIHLLQIGANRFEDL